MANVKECDITVSKFKLQSLYYVHFPTITLGKGKNTFILSILELNKKESVRYIPMFIYEKYTLNLVEKLIQVKLLFFVDCFNSVWYWCCKVFVYCWLLMSKLSSFTMISRDFFPCCNLSSHHIPYIFYWSWDKSKSSISWSWIYILFFTYVVVWYRASPFVFK